MCDDSQKNGCHSCPTTMCPKYRKTFYENLNKTVDRDIVPLPVLSTVFKNGKIYEEIMWAGKKYDNLKDALDDRKKFIEEQHD